MKTSKNTLMRFLQLMMVFVLFTGTAIAQNKANFSGKWQLDLANSTNLAKDNGKLIVVSQDPASIIISGTIFTSENTPRLLGDTVYLDGVAHPFRRNKANDFKLPKGKVSGFTRTTTPAWSDDGKSLTISTSYSVIIDDKPIAFKTVEKWALDSDGQKLTISGSTSYADSTETYTDVYALM